MLRARRRSALAALSLAALAAVTACTATNPQTTTLQYDPADGQDVDLGAVRVDSLLVVAKAGTHGPGALVARLTNDSTASRTVTFVGGGSTRLQATFTVAAGSSVAVGPRQQLSATLARLASEPGGLVRLRVSGDGGATAGRSVSVPVLTNTQPEFASLVPTTAAPTTAAPTTTAPTSAAPTSRSSERSAATGSSTPTSVRSSASASSNLSPGTRSSVASSPAAAAGSSAGK